jgi:hypothetical protein
LPLLTGNGVPTQLLSPRGAVSPARVDAARSGARARTRAALATCPLLLAVPGYRYCACTGALKPKASPMAAASTPGAVLARSNENRAFIVIS